MADFDKKDHELSLYTQWKRTNDPKHFQDLYKSMKPLITKASFNASRGSNIPESAHRAYAAQNFHDALKTYKPNKGASLQTHVYNAVNLKGNRLNFLYQDLQKKPEPRAMKIGLYQTVFESLKQDLGREPSVAEIADEAHLDKKDVVLIRKEMQKNLSLSEGVEEQITFEESKDEEVLSYLYFELTPEEQLVYDYMLGKHGKPQYTKPALNRPGGKRPDYDRIAGAVGFSSSKVRAIAKRIEKKLGDALRR